MPIILIAVAEWFGTALWFTPNAVIGDLQQLWSLAPEDLGWLTGAVQFGFLIGTLGIGLSGIADRIDASRLFALACVVGALSNALLPSAAALWPAVALRVVTGAALAGIYPIGMKLMVGWAPQRAGLGLAWLVGMLVLGTAMPHLLAGMNASNIQSGDEWRITLWLASILALVAGGIVWRLGEAPPNATDTPKPPSHLAGLSAFRIADFRRAAGAYFGHMWELYTLWALLPPLVVAADPKISPQALSLISFGLIAVGAPGCWLGGWLSLRLGSRRIATFGLAGSALCCLLFPWLAPRLGFAALCLYLALWSLLAVIDSPQFSALSARACPPTLVGSALTLQNAIGFAISAISIGLLVPRLSALGPAIAWSLLPGPLLGLIVLHRLGSRAPI